MNLRSPVGDTIAAGELRAFAGVFEKFDLHAVGIADPGLKSIFAGELLRRHRDALHATMGDGCVDVFHLQAEVVDLVTFAIAGLGQLNTST